MKKIQLSVEEIAEGKGKFALSLYINTGEEVTKRKWPETDKVEFDPDFEIVVEYTRQFIMLVKNMLNKA